MPDFAYTARDMSGKKLTGTIHAATKAEAASMLGAKSLFPIDLAPAKNKSLNLLSRRVSGTVMATQYIQLAQLLRSGVPMLRSLSLLSQQTANQSLKETMLDVRTRVEEGDGLSQAMSRHPRIFSDIAVNMVNAGSEGGFLEDALERVGKFIEQQEELKSKTLGALVYPAFIFSVGLLIVSALLIFFVPKFDPLFNRLRAAKSLPYSTEFLLTTSKFLQSYWWVIFLGGLVAYAAFRIYRSTPSGEKQLDFLKIKIPLLGSVFLSLSVARFCRVLGTLLDNGVPLLRGLDISRAAAGNVVLSKAIEDASENVTAGEQLAKPLGESKHFPPTIVEMISVAEESNTLNTVLVQISDNLEKVTFRRLEVVVKLLEPVMLLVLAAMVMFIVLALLIPVVTSSTVI